MERNNNDSGTLTPIERLRQRLNDKLDNLKYGLEQLEHGQATDVQWTRLVYEQHIERCNQWLKAIERVG